MLVPPPEKVSPALLPVNVRPIPPANVPLPASETFPNESSTLALEKKLILPVVPVPNCNVCLFVVPRMPVAVRDVAPIVPAETDAVGMPPATLVKANLADVVAVLPISRSCVVFLSKIVPLA